MRWKRTRIKKAMTQVNALDGLHPLRPPARILPAPALALLATAPPPLLRLLLPPQVPRPPQKLQLQFLTIWTITQTAASTIL